MTRSNAAHEPSMDEILASIRRIIESGDDAPEVGATSRVRPDRAPHVERLGGWDDTAANVVARLTPEPSIEDRSAEFAATDDQPAVAPGDDTARDEGESVVAEASTVGVSEVEEGAFDLAEEDDLAARLREEIAGEDLIDWSALTAALSEDAAERNPDAQQMGILAVERLAPGPASGTAMEQGTPLHAGPQAAAAPVVMGTRQEADVSRHGEADGKGTPAAPAADASRVAAQAPAATKGEDEEGAPFMAANSDSRRMQEFRAAVLDDAVEKRQPEGVSLVSGRTGELVGASFDELAEAIREGQLRSMEEMAQDLLRPMLQDWLDENLPKLVERLVREEIERVARGGRR